MRVWKIKPLLLLLLYTCMKVCWRLAPTLRFCWNHGLVQYWRVRTVRSEDASFRWHRNTSCCLTTSGNVVPSCKWMSIPNAHTRPSFEILHLKISVLKSWGPVDFKNVQKWSRKGFRVPFLRQGSNSNISNFKKKEFLHLWKVVIS